MRTDRRWRSARSRSSPSTCCSPSSGSRTVATAGGLEQAGHDVTGRAARLGKLGASVPARTPARPRRHALGRRTSHASAEHRRLGARERVAAAPARGRADRLQLQRRRRRGTGRGRGDRPRPRSSARRGGSSSPTGAAPCARRSSRRPAALRQVTVAETAIVVLVPEAEPLVGEHRRRHTAEGARGMGAHVTLLYPFRDTSHARRAAARAT